MGGSEKVRNKAQRLKGAAKEMVGRATGDVALERQGSLDLLLPPDEGARQPAMDEGTP